MALFPTGLHVPPPLLHPLPKDVLRPDRACIRLIVIDTSHRDVGVGIHLVDCYSELGRRVDLRELGAGGAYQVEQGVSRVLSSSDRFCQPRSE